MVRAESDGDPTWLNRRTRAIHQPDRHRHERLTHGYSKKLTRANEAAEFEALDGIGKEQDRVGAEYREAEQCELWLWLLTDLPATGDDLEAERTVREHDAETDADHGADDVGETATDGEVHLSSGDGSDDDPDLREH